MQRTDVPLIEETIHEARLRLKDMRLSLKMTQTAVSQKTGISQPMISAFEAGKRDLGLGDILRLCKCYNCDISYILGGEPKAFELDREKEINIQNGLIAEQLLSRPLREVECGYSDSFLILCIYKAIRTLYMSNPRHKATRLFTVSEQMLDAALSDSEERLESELPGLLDAHPGLAGKVEPDPEYAALLREFVRAAEGYIKHTPQGTTQL